MIVVGSMYCMCVCEGIWWGVNVSGGVGGEGGGGWGGVEEGWGLKGGELHLC